MSTTALAPPPLPPRRVPQSRAVSVPPRLYAGLTDDELHAHLRRFNKQVTNIGAVHLPPDKLDFGPALSSSSNGEAFSPEKLKSNFERVYLTVIKDVGVAVKHVTRIRSWEDPFRTAAWFILYFGAWQSVGVGPVALVLLALLITFPQVRTTMFPSDIALPLSAESTPDNQGKQPKQPSTDEQREREARIFAEDMADLAAVQSRPQAQADPVVATAVAEAIEEVGASVATSPEDEQPPPAATTTAQSVKVDRLAGHGLPLQQLAGDLADAWERWANALSPTSPPMHPHAARRRLGLTIAPIGILLAFVPAWMILHGCALVFGLAFFSEPLIGPAIAFLDDTYADWRQELEIRNSLLKLVPSNTQLTIAILREKEAAGTPLPPAEPLMVEVPSPTVSPTLGASTAPPSSPPPLPPRGSSESASAVTTGTHSPQLSTAAPSPATTTTSKMRKDRFASLVTYAARAAEQGAGYVSGEKRVNWEAVTRLAVDKIKTTTGSELPELVMTCVPRAPDDRSNAVFYAHHHLPGHLVLDPPLHPTYLIFRPVSSAVSAHSTIVTIPLASVVRMKKTEGLGWKGRLALGWSTGVGNVGDGIKIRWKVPAPAASSEVVTDAREKEEKKASHTTSGDHLPTLAVSEEFIEKGFTAIVRRDELFNRIAANLSGQFELL